MLATAPDFGTAFQQGFDRAQQNARQLRQDGALNALARDPEDAEARGALWAANPSVAAAYEASAHKRSEADRATSARGALSDWMLSESSARANALAMPTRGNGALSVQGPALRQTNALLAPPSQSIDVHRPSPAASAITAASAGAGQVPAQGTDAWERYVRADPSGAMKTVLDRANLTKAQNEAMFTQMDMIARLARGAVDQETYTAALRQAEGRGMDVSSLPQEFNPDAVNAIELQALTAKDWLSEQRALRKQDWDIEDDQADNERADRDTDDRISDRAARRGLTARGQNLTDARGRRGQDMTDKRVRESAGFRGSPGKPSKPAAGNVAAEGTVIQNAQGKRMVKRGGQWVPL